MRFLAALTAALLLLPALALAQTAPNWATGFVPSAAQWNGEFAAKSDYPLGAGAVNLASSQVTNILPLANLPIGTAGAAIPLLNGVNTWSSLQTFTAGVTLSGLSTGTQVSCLGLNSSNGVVLSAGACGNGSASGTVTSVGLALPSLFTVTGSPVTTSGTLTAALANENANLIFAGPTSGSAAAPAFRALVAADIPALGSLGGSINLGSQVNGSLALGSLAAIANDTVLGNVSGGSAVPIALSQTQLTALCNAFTSSLSGCAPASGGGTTNFLRADGTWAAPPGSGGGVTWPASNDLVVSNGTSTPAGLSLGANQFPLGQSGAAPVAGSLGSSLCVTSATVNTCTVDTTHTASATLANIGGQDNFNGSSLTATVPGTGTLGNGQTALVTNQNASTLTLSNSQTVNGLPLATTLHQYGFYGYTGNGTSLDAFGFPGFGTITANALEKFIDGTGAATASALSDNGTIVSSSEPIDATSNGFVSEVANAGTTGTTVNHLAKLTGAPSTAIITATTDTDNVLGIVIGGSGTSGNAQIAVSGQAACAFDGATTAGDYVAISATTAGDCHDAGASRPLGSQTIGRVLSTNAAAGTYAVALGLGTTNTGGGGSGTVNSGTAGQIAAYSATGTAVSGETVSGDCTHAVGGAFTCPIKAVPTASGSGSQTLTGNANLYVCSAACTITLPTPAAGIEACVRNAPGVSTAITLAAMGGSAQYEKTDNSGYGTAGTGTLTSGGAVGDKVCVHGLDSTHYLIGSYNGTWTAS